MNRVGIRSLKQNASAVLERVKRGESVEVTERGEPIALIIPIPEPAHVVERLISEGRATPPTGSLSDLPPPMAPRPGRRLPSEILRELREYER
jgi:prevent-host-death family protein